MIDPEHRAETHILFTKPLAFLLHCFQALLNIVLTRHVAVHCYKFQGRSYPRNEAIKRPILRPVGTITTEYNLTPSYKTK